MGLTWDHMLPVSFMLYNLPSYTNLFSWKDLTITLDSMVEALVMCELPGHTFCNIPINIILSLLLPSLGTWLPPWSWATVACEGMSCSRSIDILLQVITVQQLVLTITWSRWNSLGIWSSLLLLDTHLFDFIMISPWRSYLGLHLIQKRICTYTICNRHLRTLDCHYTHFSISLTRSIDEISRERISAHLLIVHRIETVTCWTSSCQAFW